VTDIISPRMLQQLPKFFPSNCTIQSRTDTADTYGQPIPTWANAAGLSNIPCRIAPAKGDERKLADQTYTVGDMTCVLAGNYTAIAEKMRAVVDAVTYDIVAVDHDDQATTTRLALRLVE